jgi:hypothetical protein
VHPERAVLVMRELLGLPPWSEPPTGRAADVLQGRYVAAWCPGGSRIWPGAITERESDAVSKGFMFARIGEVPTIR